MTPRLVADATCTGPLVEHNDGVVECRWVDCPGIDLRHEMGMSCGWAEPIANGWYVAGCGGIVDPWPRYRCAGCNHIPRRGPITALRARPEIRREDV